jgi:hypothetical protein
MSQFTEPLIAELIGKNLWKVYKEFDYHVGSYPSNEVIKVPAGFITNFASVPRWLWPVISPIDDHGKAAVVHDYCYEVRYASKKRCDDIFHEALLVLGVSEYKAALMYWSVRWLAWWHWFKCRLADY